MAKRNSGMLDMHEALAQFRQEVFEEVSSVQSDLSGFQIAIGINPTIVENKQNFKRQLKDLEREYKEALNKTKQAIEKEVDQKTLVTDIQYKTDKNGKRTGIAQRTLYKDETDINKLIEYKDRTLQHIKELSTITDGVIQSVPSDQKKFEQLVQYMKNYAGAMHRIRELYDQSGKTYNLDKDDIDLGKSFKGFQVTKTLDENLKALTNGFRSLLESTIQQQIDATKNQLDAATQEYNRHLAHNAQKAEGVDYEAQDKAYKDSLAKLDQAKKDESNILSRIQSAIQAEVDAYLKAEDEFLNMPINISEEDEERIATNLDQRVANLKKAIQIVDSFKLNISALAEVKAGSDKDFVDDGTIEESYVNLGKSGMSFRNNILNREAEWSLGNRLNKDFISDLLKLKQDAGQAKVDAEKQVAVNKEFLNGLVSMFETMLNTEQGQAAVQKVAQAQVDELQSKVKELESQIDELKKNQSVDASGAGTGGSAAVGSSDNSSKQNDTNKTDISKSDNSEFNNALKVSAESLLRIDETASKTAQSITTLGDAASKVAGTLENVSNLKADDAGNTNTKASNGGNRTRDWKVALSKYDQPFIYDVENNEKAMSDAFARVHMLSEDNRLFHQYIGRLSDDLAKYSTKDANQQSLINTLTEIGRLTSDISMLERELTNNDDIDVESYKSEIERKTSELNQLKQSIEQTVSLDKPVYSEIVSQIMTWYERVLDTERKLQDVLERVKVHNPDNPEYADSLEDYFYNRVNPVKDAFDNKVAITTAKGVANTQKRLSDEDDRRAIEAQRIINSNQAQITKYEQLIESGKRLTADEEKHLAVLREEVAEQQKLLDSINASASAKEKINALESKRENTVLGLEAKASRAQLNQSEKEYAESVKASERARAEAQAEEAKNAEIESKAFIKAANESTQQYLTAVKTIVDTTEEFIKLNSKIGRGEDLQNEESVRYDQVLTQRTQAYDVISKSNTDPITIADGERRMADAAELATAKILDEAKAFEELEKAKAKAEAERLAKQQEAEAKQMQADEDKRAINAQRIINSNQQQISDYQARLKNGEQLTQEEAEHLKILEDENVAASEILNTYRYSNDALDKIVSLEAKREKIEAKVNAKYSSKQAKQSAKEADDQQKAENIAAKNASEVIRKNYEQLERLRRKGASDAGFTEEDLQLFQRLTKESEEAGNVLANSKADASLLVELAGQRAKEEDRVAAKLREELDIQERQKQRATSKMENDFVKLEQARLELLRSEEQLNYDNSNTSQARYKNAKLNLDQLTDSIKRNAQEAGISENTVNEYFQRFQDGAADAAADVKAEFENMRRSLGESLGTGLTQDDVRESLQGWVSKYGGSNLTDLFDAGIDKRGIHNFTASFKDAEGNIRKVKASLTELNGELFVTADQGKKAQSAFQDFFDGVKQRLVNFAQYVSSFVSAWQMINMLRQGFAIVKDLDAAFVELKRISNDSTAALEDFRKKQFELADTVGSTSATVMNAATEWEHLGYSIKEAEELAKTSAVYKNIADGMTSDSEATEDLVSILKAYNKTAKDAMDVTDALIATSNNYAVTAADIGNILKRSSAALAMGGNTFEQTVALGTAMSEVLQSAEVAGSSLKVLSLRLRSSSTELKEMGEDVDDLVTSTPKLQQKIKALTKGFDILSSDGKTIKSTYDIMKGIASVWKDMSDVNQAALLELIAGKTRAQGVSALLSNWDQVDKVLKTIAEDEGTALRNNEEKLNTINGRIIQLTNASQRLAQDAFNTEFIKDFISAGTDAVNLLDQIINKIGTIPTVIGAIGAASTFTKGGGQLNQSSYPNRMKSYKAPGIVRGNTKQVHAF